MWSYEREQERLQTLLDEFESEEAVQFDDESDNEEVDNEIFSEHNSESEQSVEEGTEDAFVLRR